MNRRNFLRTSSLASSVALLPTSALLALEADNAAAPPPPAAASPGLSGNLAESLGEASGIKPGKLKVIPL